MSEKLGKDSCSKLVRANGDDRVLTLYKSGSCEITVTFRFVIAEL